MAEEEQGRALLEAIAVLGRASGRRRRRAGGPRTERCSGCDEEVLLVGDLVLDVREVMEAYSCKVCRPKRGRGPEIGCPSCGGAGHVGEHLDAEERFVLLDPYGHVRERHAVARRQGEALHRRHVCEA